MFSSWPVSAFVAGVKIAGSIRSESRSPPGGRCRRPAAALVVLEAGARDVSTDHALDRQHVGLHDQHRAALELVGEAGQPPGTRRRPRSARGAARRPRAVGTRTATSASAARPCPGSRWVARRRRHSTGPSRPRAARCPGRRRRGPCPASRAERPEASFRAAGALWCRRSWVLRCGAVSPFPRGREVYRNPGARGKGEKHAGGPRRARPRSPDVDAYRLTPPGSPRFRRRRGRGKGRRRRRRPVSGSPLAATAGASAPPAPRAVGRRPRRPAIADRVSPPASRRRRRSGAPLRRRRRAARTRRAPAAVVPRREARHVRACHGATRPRARSGSPREPRGARRRASPSGDLRLEHDPRREPRAAALDLEIDGSGEAVERHVRPSRGRARPARGPSPRGRRGRRWPRPARHPLERDAACVVSTITAPATSLARDPAVLGPARRRRPRARGGPRRTTSRPGAPEHVEGAHRGVLAPHDEIAATPSALSSPCGRAIVEVRVFASTRRRAGRRAWRPP